MAVELTEISRQRGVFVIEMALLLFFIAALLLFTGDIAMQLFKRVDLDRTSYALVNIVRDRTRFYDGRWLLSQQDTSDMSKLAGRLLRGNGQFGLRVESLRNGHYQVFNRPSSNGGVMCTNINPLNSASAAALVPVTKTGKSFALYQVTLCAEVDDWFNKFMKNNSGNTSLLQSNSVVVGR